MKAVVYFPWCLKLLFGLLSDCYPIGRSHRKSYFVIGWMLFITSNIGLYLSQEPSPFVLILLSFIQTVGLVLANTVADGMIVEATAFESQSCKGKMRIQTYLVRAGGMVVGSVLASALSSSEQWGWSLNIAQCFLLQGIIPAVLILPLVFWMGEVPYRGDCVLSIPHMLTSCSHFASIDAVWIPMLYLFVYNMCSIQNQSWSQFLHYGLEISDFEIGVLMMAGACVGVLGIFMFDRFFFDKNWKLLYVITTCACGLFSLLQLCLCYHFTFGLPDIIFAIGDSSIQTASQLVSFLPMVMMFLVVIPDGSEATVYALITTWLNVATELGAVIGYFLNCFVGVTTSDEYRDGKWGKLELITLISSLVQLMPLMFIYAKFKSIQLLPSGRREMRSQFDKNNTSVSGVWVCGCLLVLSVLLSLGQAILLIFELDGCF